MQNNHHRTVIFDYGCVISKPQSVVSIQKIVEKLNLRDTDHYRKIYSVYRKEIDSGLITLHEYWEKTLHEFRMNVSGEDLDWLVLEDIKSWADINEDTLTLIRDLKKNGIRLAILSNMVIETLDYLRKNTSFIPLFDHEFFSCDINLIKPNPEIYKYILRAMQTEPEGCVFIDDIEENCRAAEAQGIYAIRFQDGPGARSELQGLGIALN